MKTQNSTFHDQITDDLEWETICSRLPENLEEMARETGALQRKRKVRSAEALLRLVLAYALLDWPFRLIGAWATVLGLGSLSDVAVWKRLSTTLPWLGRLIGVLLERQGASFPSVPVSVRVVDTTTVSQPGSRGTDWRLHARFHLGQFRMIGVEITDAQGGETLQRHPAQPNEITLADGGYAHPAGLGRLLAALAFFVVRINWQNLRLETAEGQRFDLIGWLKSQSHFPCETPVWLVTPLGRWEVRLIAQALPAQKAEAARRRVRQASQKKGHTPRKETLFAAGYLLLLTNLPAGVWGAEAIVGLYRLRWQVELLFKRLKQILHLENLRVKDPVLAQVYLLGKVLALLLTEEVAQVAADEWDRWMREAERPLSAWRWTVFWTDLLRRAVQGALTLAQVVAALPHLRRYLCDAPRKRRSAAALIRKLLLESTSPAEVATGCQLLAYA